MPGLPPPRHQQMPDGTWSKPEGQVQPGGPDWWQATDGLWYVPALVRLPAAIPTPRGWPPYAIVFGGLWLMLASRRRLRGPRSPDSWEASRA